MNEWLLKIRQQRNMTQEDVANAADILRASYTMIETGKRSPSVGLAKKIAAVLGFDWTLFFANDGNEMTHSYRKKTNTT